MRLAGLLLTIWTCSIVISLPGSAICQQSGEREQVGSILEIRGPVYWKKNAKAKETLLDPVRDGDGNRAINVGEMVRCGKGGFLRIMLNRVERKIESKDWVSISLELPADMSEDTRKAGRKAKVMPASEPVKDERLMVPEVRAGGRDESRSERTEDRRASVDPEAKAKGASKGERKEDASLRPSEIKRPEDRAEKSAATPSAPASSGRATVSDIFERYNRALFREYPPRERMSELAKGTVELPTGVSGNLTIYTKAPDKATAIMDVPGFGTVQEVLNGKSAWVQSPPSGVREALASELLLAKFGPEFYRGSNLKQAYKKLELKGAQVVGDRMAYVVEASPFEGELEKLYFDVSTGLLIRVDSMLSSPGGNVLFESYLEDYRDVGGVKIPFTVRRVSPFGSFTIKLSEVKHDVPVEDAKFNKP